MKDRAPFLATYISWPGGRVVYCVLVRVLTVGLVLVVWLVGWVGFWEGRGFWLGGGV